MKNSSPTTIEIVAAEGKDSSIDLLGILCAGWVISSAIDKLLQSFIHQVSQTFSPLGGFTVKPEAAPIFALFKSVSETGVIEHPILLEFFPSGFDRDALEKEWQRIRASLWERRPQSLMIQNREERYEQLLKAQSAQAYIAVCRGTYPEIERLLRDIIFEDSAFLLKLKNENDLKKRRQLIQGKFKELTLTDKQPWGIDVNSLSLEEVGIFNTACIVELEKCFESFDPVDAFSGNDKHLGGNRHFHQHGWSNKADYIDGLKSLLLFDLVMQLSAQRINKIVESSSQGTKGEAP